MTAQFQWKSYLYYFWKENFPQDMFDKMDEIGELHTEKGVFTFDPTDRRFAEYADQFRSFRPTQEAVRVFKLNHPELFGREVTQSTKDRMVELNVNSPEHKLDLTKFYSDDALEIIQSRAKICSGCDNNVQLNQTTVECSLCGCPGVSLLNGKCRAVPTKW